MKKKLLAVIFALTVVFQLTLPAASAAADIYKSANVMTKGTEMLLPIYDMWRYEDAVTVGVSIYYGDGWYAFDRRYCLTEDEEGVATVTGFDAESDIYLYSDFFYLELDLDNMSFNDGTTREDFEKFLDMERDYESIFYDEDFDVPVCISAYIYKGKVRPTALYVLGEKVASIDKYEM